MKKFLVLFLMLLMNTPCYAIEPVAIFLIDPQDKETQREIAYADTKSTNQLPAKTIDEILDGFMHESVPSKTQERIAKKIAHDEVRFIEDLNKLTTVPFDEKDDKANAEFSEICDDLVGGVFSAWTEKTFYKRLYLINKVWLENQDKRARFDSLDQALRDKWLEREDFRKKWRQRITTIGGVGGALVLGYFSVKQSFKWIPVVADEKGLTALARWAGRVPLWLVGFGFGATMGSYAGFLGSDLIFKYRGDYIDPIDGTEDLREILDILDRL